MFLKIRRTFKSGAKNLARNSLLSFATVSVLAVALFIINIQAGTTMANYLLLQDVQDKVNVSVYVKNDLSEDETIKIKEQIESYAEVKNVRYVSKEEAFEDFKKRNEDNEMIKKSIEELGGNPLGAVLNIKAYNPDQYETISKKIEESEFIGNVSKVNYQKYRGVIDSLNAGIKANQKSAIILGTTLTIIAIMITFNTIKVNMYAHKKEIEIMRLVGASNNYIRLPFIWEGIFYGFIAAAISIPLSYFYLDYISNQEVANAILPFSNARFIKGFLSDYFIRYLAYVISGQFLLGILMGVISSLLAIRKYLRV